MKNIKTILFVLSIALISQFNVFSMKKFILKDLGRPVSINVDKNQLYIIENHRIHIYSIDDFKLLKRFGKKGQGPGEFQTLPHVHITLDPSTDKLIIGSIRKVSYFSKKGVFIKEVKGKNQALRLIYMDKDNGKPRFLGWSQKAYNKFNYNTIVVFDYQLEKIKQIYKVKDPFQGPGKGYNLLTKTFNYIYHKQKILIPGKDGNSIDILNTNFDLDFTINIDLKPLTVSKDFKKNMIHFLKTSPDTKNVFQMISPVRFPKYFPNVNQFFADNGKIYVMTWEKSAKGNTFYIYDMKGKYTGKNIIPIKYETDIQTYPLSLKNGKLYQLVENDDEDEWELLVSEI